jgi:hypothetical protein
VLKIAPSRPGEHILSIWQRGIVGHQSYSWIFEIAPAKFPNLHSKPAKSLTLFHIKNPDAVWIYADPSEFIESQHWYCRALNLVARTGDEHQNYAVKTSTTCYVVDLGLHLCTQHCSILSSYKQVVSPAWAHNHVHKQYPDTMLSGVVVFTRFASAGARAPYLQFVTTLR